MFGLIENTVTEQSLAAFEDEVAAEMAAGRVHTPTHLCGGNEAQLIEVFKNIKPEDWVFATYRNHYHALLHGVPSAQVMQQILAGRSMTPNYPGYRFFTSAIVGGCLPIAVGTAAALKRSGSEQHVWCFVGDMAAETGAFYEAQRYAGNHALPITFVVEDNGLACDTPTREVVPSFRASARVIHYSYVRKHPHMGKVA